MLRLTEFKYSEPNWMTEHPISLFETNLIVGKNATGKTFLLKNIVLVVRTLLDKRMPHEIDSFYAELRFIDSRNTVFEYKFVIREGKIEIESFYKIEQGSNIEQIIARFDSLTTLKGQNINPPADKLIVNVRRDTILYPEIEQLLLWAENNISFSFNELDMYGDDGEQFLYGINGNLYNMVKKMSQSQLSHAVEVINKIGYPIKDIRPAEEPFKKILFNEEGVSPILLDRFISKGMFRCIYTIILVEYIASLQFKGMLSIDDFCEGLDYSHSTKLGKYVFSFCKENGIQLLASSNDSFLMDVVDMRYWNYLIRKEGKINSYNYQNSKQLFDDFMFTGLSNFDFFSSDYIHRHQTTAQ